VAATASLDCRPITRRSEADKHDGTYASPAMPRPPNWHERESFAGQDLRQVNLDGHYFKMCNLTAVDLRGASLRGAWFAFCDL
jgi:hypothetical protein